MNELIRELKLKQEHVRDSIKYHRDQLEALEGLAKDIQTEINRASRDLCERIQSRLF
jgi:predicted transcriptional regulator